MRSSDVGNDFVRLVRVVLLGALFLLLVATVSAPIILVLHVIYEPLAHPYVMLAVMGLVGFWLWRTIDWK